MLQASLAIGVLAVSYGFHARHLPFVTPDEQALAHVETARRAWHEKGVGLADQGTGPATIGRPRRAAVRRASVAALAGAAADAAARLAHGADALVDFNVLETVLLSASSGVLLGGMIFQSAAMEQGGHGYVFLTVLVSALIIGSVALFIWMLGVETRRACRRGAPPGTSLGLGSGAAAAAAVWTEKPLRHQRKSTTNGGQ
jgi:hypothetical protein